MYDICIIGTGFSGIISTIECINNNFKTITLEQNSDIGGTWFKTYPNTRLQSHKRLYQFDGYPYPSGTSEYPTQKEIIKYLDGIVNTTGIREHIIFNKKVINLINKPNYWEIVIEDTKNILKSYDNIQAKYIIVATGLFSVPKVSKIPGLKNFYGSVLHSKSVNNDYNPRDKNIVVIGNGSSGIDLATLSCNMGAKNVYIIYRSPKWIFMRDFFNPSHYYNYFTLLILYYLHLNGFRKINMLMFKIAFIIIYIVKLYLKGPFSFPNKPISRANIVINDYFLQYFNQGKLHYINKDIVEVNNDNIILSDRKISNVDVIILATGYKKGPNFFNYQVPALYKHIIAIDRQYTNIFFMGFASTLANLPKLLQNQIKYIIKCIRTKLNVNVYEKVKENLYNLYITDKLGVPENDITYNYYNYIKSLK